MKTYEIFALKYAGPLEGPAMMLQWMKRIGETARRGYFFWCIRGAGGDPDETFIVDAGFSPAAAADREIPGYVNPVEMLARLGVDAACVKHVILTHLHWDHANGVSLFPNAAFYVQGKEYRFWKENPLAQRPPFRHIGDDGAMRFLSTLEGSPRLVILDGDTDIKPGICCVLAPGHSVGLQVVTVQTAKGAAVVGSDCAHVFENYTEDWPSSIITDMLEWLRTYDKVRALVSDTALLFPGHDMRMVEDYHLVAKDVTKLA